MGSMTLYDVGNQLSTRILEAARAVNDRLGTGATEQQYRRAVVQELRWRHLDVLQRFPVDVWQENELAELFFLDLFVEMLAVVEISAGGGPFLHSDLSDLAAELACSGGQIGLLINFGVRDIHCERVLPHRRSTCRQL